MRRDELLPLVALTHGAHHPPHAAFAPRCSHPFGLLAHDFPSLLMRAQIFKAADCPRAHRWVAKSTCTATRSTPATERLLGTRRPSRAPRSLAVLPATSRAPSCIMHRRALVAQCAFARAVPCAQDAQTALARNALARTVLARTAHARTAHARTVHARTELGPFTLHARSIARLASHVSHRMSRIACRIARLAWMSCFVLHAILSARLQRVRSERTRPHPEPHRGRAWPA